MKLGEGSTPGPWKASITMGALYVHGTGLNNATVCRMGENDHADANARLIAKAPLLVEARDVLAALVACQDELQGKLPEIVYRTASAARAMLAKLEAV